MKIIALSNGWGIMIHLTHGLTTMALTNTKSTVFATMWPGFHKFSQVIMLYVIYFIKHYHLFFKDFFYYEPESAYLYYSR